VSALPNPELTHYLESLGFGLVHVPPGTKGPNTTGWQDNPITTPEQAAQVWRHGGGLGLHHAASGTAVLDIDHLEWAELALAAVDIDLGALLAAPGPKIRGAKGPKPVYRLPDGLELTRKALAWKPPGAEKAVTVLELRAGKVQDVLPPSIHPDTGNPYTWEPAVPQRREDIPELPGGLLALWQHWGQLKAVLDKAQPWAKPPPPRTYKEPPEGGSVIAAFNESYSFSADNILEPHGYILKGAGRWLSPNSQSGTPGVVLLKGDDGLERVYCHHASDPLYSEEHAHDAFSAWLILEHGGDIKAAVREAAKKLKMSYTKEGNATFTSGDKTAQGEPAAAEEEVPWIELQPIPDLYPPVPQLPPELVPEPLRAWLADIAERTSLPLEFVACPALVALGAVIGRSLGNYPKRFDDWLVVPNLWGGIVGRPGVMKTAAISEATKPLRALAAKARERFEEAQRAAEAEKSRLELEVSALKEQAKRDAKKGGIHADFQATLRDLATQLEEATVTERRYLTQDATTEKLGELLRENPRGMLLLRDELAGWLRILERPGREGEREFYLEAWNGTGGYTFDRIGRGTVHVDALTLSILGAIQPGKLERYLQEAIAGGGGADGLLQRFQLVVWPDNVGEYVPVDRYPDGAARRRANAIFEALDALDPAELGLDAQEGEIPALHFSNEAQALFDMWRGELERRFRNGELAYKPAFESHLSKYRSLMPSLALIFHLVEVADGGVFGPVSLESAQLAAAWCDFLEAHALKLYAPEVSSHIKAAQLLARHIEDGDIEDGKLTVRDLYRRGWEGLDDRETVVSGLEVLAENNWVRIEEKVTGGRPTQVVRLHPTLRQGKR
jgi:hypothetical protein